MHPFDCPLELKESEQMNGCWPFSSTHATGRSYCWPKHPVSWVPFINKGSIVKTKRQGYETMACYSWTSQKSIEYMMSIEDWEWTSSVWWPGMYGSDCCYLFATWAGSELIHSSCLQLVCSTCCLALGTRLNLNKSTLGLEKHFVWLVFKCYHLQEVLLCFVSECSKSYVIVENYGKAVSRRNCPRRRSWFICIQFCSQTDTYNIQVLNCSVNNGCATISPWFQNMCPWRFHFLCRWNCPVYRRRPVPGCCSGCPGRRNNPS